MLHFEIDPFRKENSDLRQSIEAVPKSTQPNL